MGSAQHIIEFENTSFLVSGTHISNIERFEESTGDKLLVCDFEGAITRVMNVEAPVKYAEAMVIRTLQEEGDFDEPVTILTHQKNKRGDRTTEIFFTAIPSHLYIQYLERINEHEDAIILVPLYAVLFHFLKKIPAKKHIAVVFRHGRFADLLVGNKKRVIFASRATGFDETQEQVASLWDMVRQDIATAQEDSPIKIEKVICLNWVDTYTDKTIKDLPPDPKYFAFKEEPVFFQGQTCNLSFLKAVKMVPATMGVTKSSGMMLFYTRKFSYAAILVLFFFAIGLTALSFHYKKNSGVIEQDIARMNQRINKMTQQISLKPFNKEFTPVFSFVDQFEFYKNAPSFKTIIHDMDSGLFNIGIIENIRITYSDKDVKTDVYGTIESDFESAYKGYHILKKTIETKGYSIIEDSFNTRIDNSEFRLIFSRDIQ